MTKITLVQNQWTLVSDSSVTFQIQNFKAFKIWGYEGDVPPTTIPSNAEPYRLLCSLEEDKYYFEDWEFTKNTGNLYLYTNSNSAYILKDI